MSYEQMETRNQMNQEQELLVTTFQARMSELNEEGQEAFLWDTLSRLSHVSFETSGRGDKGGVPFSFEIRGREMFIDRKEKSLTYATMMMAFRKAKQLQYVKGPKMLGTFGASYLYPIFLKLGICQRSEKKEE